MALKRKRSSHAFASPSSNCSNISEASSASSMPFWYNQSKPVETLYSKPTWSFPTYDDTTQDYCSSSVMSTSHLGSRTRKRHRDDRPEEAAVYASTLNRLYEAQRKHLDAQPVPSQLPPSAAVSMQQSQTQSQKSTLHSFWQLPGVSQPTIAKAKAAQQDAMMQVDSAMTSVNSLESRCETCDGSLEGDNSESMDVDDGILEIDTQCQGCGRHVCNSCAISANHRVCLGCASRY